MLPPYLSNSFAIGSSGDILFLSLPNASSMSSSFVISGISGTIFLFLFVCMLLILSFYSLLSYYHVLPTRGAKSEYLTHIIHTHCDRNIIPSYFLSTATCHKHYNINTVEITQGQ